VFPSRRVVPYLIAQFAGAIVAAWLLLLAFGGPVNNLGATLVAARRAGCNVDGRVTDCIVYEPTSRTMFSASARR
jgi:glycerol uptake facilitator-like aquaporin